MAKSKIKRVESSKEFTNSYGTTIYHNLEMDNGDKINIGKKKLQQVGWELSYEIVDSGQEYNKAKTLKEDNFTPSAGAKGNNADYVKGIEVGHAINNAVNLMCAGVELEIPESAKTTEQKIYYTAKQIMLISEQLKSE